nr:hypothetical protein [Tanacetum cinerariifolium]
MTSFNQSECVGSGQPCDGFYCYLCTCQHYGVNLINGICLNCIYGDGKPVTCCECEGPLNGGFCSFCTSRVENSFAYDSHPNSFDDSQNLSDYPPQPQYQAYSCKLCGNDAHYGYDCPPQGILGDSSNAITPDLPNEKPDNSLNIGDKHLSSIPDTESDEVIESSVENLVPILSKSEDTSGSDKDIECKDSYDFNLDESTFLVTPLSDSNEDENFAPGDDLELLLHRDPSTPIMSVVSILKGFINEPPLKDNDDLFD